MKDVVRVTDRTIGLFLAATARTSCGISNCHNCSEVYKELKDGKCPREYFNKFTHEEIRDFIQKGTDILIGLQAGHANIDEEEFLKMWLEQKE